MAKYLSIVEYKSVNFDFGYFAEGGYSVSKRDFFKFDLDEGKDPRKKNRELVRTWKRENLIGGRVKSRLFKIMQEIRLD